MNRRSPTAVRRAQIIAGDREWPVRIVHHWAARRYVLAHDSLRGELRLTVPRRGSIPRALRWAAEQKAWLQERSNHTKEICVVGDGTILPYRGVPIEICWEDGRVAKNVQLNQGKLWIGGTQAGVSGRVERWLRSVALALLNEESHTMAAESNLHLERVAIGDTKTRWGSCSSRGILRYSWRLILAPDYVRRAIVAHEVAHLRHMNHSTDFHDLVAVIYGADVAPARQWLRKEGRSLQLYCFNAPLAHSKTPLI